MELWFLFFEARCRHIGLYIPDELRRSISAPSAEGRWPGEDPALNKGPTPLPTALPGLLPQGGSSSLGFSPYNRFESNNITPPFKLILQVFKNSAYQIRLVVANAAKVVALALRFPPWP